GPHWRSDAPITAEHSAHAFAAGGWKSRRTFVPPGLPCQHFIECDDAQHAPGVLLTVNRGERINRFHDLVGRKGPTGFDPPPAREISRAGERPVAAVRVEPRVLADGCRVRWQLFERFTAAEARASVVGFQPEFADIGHACSASPASSRTTVASESCVPTG